ncbi:MAG: hypothetical protein AAF892_13070 [Cyanobacteria bacterium P01_D01_bin.71]
MGRPLAIAASRCTQIMMAKPIFGREPGGNRIFHGAAAQIAYTISPG